MAKKEIETIDISSVFSSLMEEYDKAQSEYKSVWGKKKKLMIGLFFLGILPGLGYKVFSWNKKKSLRVEEANNFFGHILESMSNGENKDFPIDNIKASIKNITFALRKPLPSNRLKRMVMWKNQKVNDMMKRNQRGFRDFVKFMYNSPSTSSNVAMVANIMEEAGMSPFLVGKPKRSRYKKGSAPQGAKLLSTKTLIESSAKLSMTINGVLVNLFNVKNTLEEKFAYVQEGKRKEVTESTPQFTGVLASIDSEILYEHPLMLISKKWPIKPNKNFDVYKAWKKPEYDLASDQFVEEIDMYLQKEEGAMLRKAFQPRVILQFGDFAEKSRKFIFTSSPKSGIAVAMEAVKINDLPLFIEKPGKFFKNEEKAKEMLEQDLQPILTLANLVNGLVNNKFLKTPPLASKEELEGMAGKLDGLSESMEESIITEVAGIAGATN